LESGGPLAPAELDPAELLAERQGLFEVALDVEVACGPGAPEPELVRLAG